MIIYSQKYFDKYNQIIKYYKCVNLSKTFEFYTESHHIIPKSMGGDNSKENLVRVPARVHFLLHWMLYRIYRTPGLAYSWHLMSLHSSNTYGRFNSKSYEYARLALSKSMIGKQRSSESRRKMSESSKGKLHTEETKKKMSISRIGRTPMLGKHHSDEAKLKISNSSKGRHVGKILSKEHKKKISDSKKGKPISDLHRNKLLGRTLPEETKIKISKSLKNKPLKICPHCNISGTHNMYRYHFDRCKMKL